MRPATPDPPSVEQAADPALRGRTTWRRGVSPSRYLMPLSFAAILGGIAWLWAGDISIGLVMSAAMVVTMIVAGLADPRMKIEIEVTARLPG